MENSETVLLFVTGIVALLISIASLLVLLVTRNKSRIADDPRFTSACSAFFAGLLLSVSGVIEYEVRGIVVLISLGIGIFTGLLAYIAASKIMRSNEDTVNYLKNEEIEN